MEIRKITNFETNDVYDISIKELSEESWTLDDLNKIVNDKNYYFVGMYEEEKLVSFCICIQSVDDINITSIATLNEFKHRGYATKLIEHFKDLAQCTYRTLSLEVSSKNEEALKLYKKCGFNVVNIRKAYYKDKSDAIIMFLK